MAFQNFTSHYFSDFLSPGVHTLAVMHEVFNNLKGKADRIACGNSIHHFRLIVLMDNRKTSSLMGVE